MNLPFNHPHSFGDSLGFTHKVLSCGYCGDQDKLVLIEAKRTKIEAWAERHKDCEATGRLKWPKAKA